MSNIDQIISEIDGLEDIFLHCKSFFPALSNDLLGEKSFLTAEFYRSRGYEVVIQTGNPITQEFMDKYLRIGKWLNENVIIRLYGIMDHHKLLKKIDKTITGWKEVDLMRRMRNIFTKTKLNYQPNDPENIRLRQEVITHFSLPEAQYPEGEIPTPIDKVIRPIFEGCRKYIRSMKESA